ncbi:paramyosin, long form, putative [Pediculus humanus corporis]|uniref:TRAF3-interacting protein 1 n=1 Tax=Pediculus humanus subsp. corporis TaxID=121224 RepID=E0VUG2_PEDHC|nr:paramyosin, long form, putative [Pediculus humanus corporis]EEB17018.1 paramyosin, long form, putative [Pediculus humanus corporis]
MSEDVKPEVIKATQDALGKFIKKPILTDKLLKKPPFRFLHDICTYAMKETGYLTSVINQPEDKFENIKDREGKIAFLQKVIAAVEASNGTKLTVKPTKIVAGLEATKTNEFLQALGKAIKKYQVESKSTKTSKTKTKTSRSHSKDTKEDLQDKKLEKGSTKSLKTNLETQEQENNIKKLPSDNNTPISGTKTKNKKIEEGTVKENDKKTHDKKTKEKKLKIEHEEESNTLKSSSGKSKNKLVELNNLNGSGENVDLQNVDVIRVSNTNGQGDHKIIENEMKEHVEHVENEEVKRKNTGKQKHRHSPTVKSGLHEERNTHEKLNEIIQNKDTVKDQKHELDESQTHDRIHSSSRPKSIQQEQIPITSPSELKSYQKKEIPLAREGSFISRPKTGIRVPSVRPASARPAAPRIREKTEIVETDETKKNNNPNAFTSGIKEGGEGEHGHLVEQILEVQKELEESNNLMVASEEKPSDKTEIEWELSRNSESANRELDKLRANIQTLTRSANPLGKLLDFFQEDVDTIQRELESLKNKNSSLIVEIAHEKSITEQFIEPLKVHLKEIQQSIDEEFEQITVVKANIIRNNIKIQKLLAGI